MILPALRISAASVTTIIFIYKNEKHFNIAIHSTHSLNFAQVKSMDDNCGEQEVGVASGSGWNLWVWLLGVVVRRYIDFLILLIPTPLVSVLFLQQHPYFLFILKMFFVLVPVLFCNYFYVLNNFFAQYKHTYKQLLASNGSHMKVAHTVLYMKKHTQTYASYPTMDISGMSVV